MERLSVLTQQIVKRGDANILQMIPYLTGFIQDAQIKRKFKSVTDMAAFIVVHASFPHFNGKGRRIPTFR